MKAREKHVFVLLLTTAALALWGCSHGKSPEYQGRSRAAPVIDDYYRQRQITLQRRSDEYDEAEKGRSSRRRREASWSDKQKASPCSTTSFVVSTAKTVKRLLRRQANVVSTRRTGIGAAKLEQTTKRERNDSENQ
ncbi:MAG: hypothetical protein L0Y58_15930 [Verrucomicrobia subdivision 3 bacterium]|nr:hypothetical protein [Limisphaerales bacterium]